MKGHRYKNFTTTAQGFSCKAGGPWIGKLNAMALPLPSGQKRDRLTLQHPQARNHGTQPVFSTSTS
jgi:hypothetical protein